MIWLLLAAVIILGFGFVVFVGAPWVPSQRKYLEKAFDTLYELGPKDVLVDLGSGDGKVLRAASRRGTKAIGYEIHPFFVWLSRRLSHGDKNISVRTVNFWRTPLPDDVTIVYVFAVERDAKKLVKKMQQEANRLGRVIPLMTLATTMPGMTYAKHQDAYYLYEFRPLQTKTA